MSTTPPVVPAAPVGTPAWLIRGAALLLAIIGPVLTWWNPGGGLNTGNVQAAIILGFLLVAGVLFFLHVLLGAIHEYGWSRAALDHVVTAEEAEFKTLWPQIRNQWAVIQPDLANLVSGSETVQAVESRVAAVEAAVSDMSASEKAAIEAVVRQLVIPGVLNAAPADPAAQGQVA